jgi:hypothetical protein
VGARAAAAVMFDSEGLQARYRSKLPSVCLYSGQATLSIARHPSPVTQFTNKAVHERRGQLRISGPLHSAGVVQSRCIESCKLLQYMQHKQFKVEQYSYICWRWEMLRVYQLPPYPDPWYPRVRHPNKHHTPYQSEAMHLFT